MATCKQAGDDANHLKRAVYRDGLCHTDYYARKRTRRRQGRLSGVRKFGWSETEYMALRDDQRTPDGRVRCPCGRPVDRGKEPAMDHDHAKERAGVPIEWTVRGLLCSNCNRFLGLIGDRPEALIALALHLIAPRAPEVLRRARRL